MTPEMKIPSDCIVCNSKIENQGHLLCLDCLKPCTVHPINPEKLDSVADGEMTSMNVKSDCCNSDVSFHNIKSTCSNACHEELIKRVESEHGKFFEETDMNGEIRIIPTRVILEHGALTEEEILKFPKKGVHSDGDGCECYVCKNGMDEFKKHQDDLMSKHGWIIHFVSPKSGDNRFNVHTHGLLEKYNHPDIQIMAGGLNPETANVIIHDIVDRIKDGERFKTGERYDKIIKNLDVKFESAVEGGRPVLRVIFPDKNNEFAGEFYESQIRDLMLN